MSKRNYPEHAKIEISTVVYSSFFSCYSPCSYCELDTMYALAGEMQEEYDQVRSGEISEEDCSHAHQMDGEFPEGEYEVDQDRLANELMRLWFKGFFDFWEEAVKEIGIGGHISMSFLEASRPEEYNFESDAARIEWFIDEEASDWLYQFILKNKEDFDEFLQHAHGKRDGFTPFDPVTADDWLDWFLNTEHYRYHRDINLVIGRAFDFVLFGQQDGKFSEEIFDERRQDFRERYWDEDYVDNLGEIEDKCIQFVPAEKTQRVPV